jgi:cell fate regulator YaaT (PSP1 superfamily)
LSQNDAGPDCPEVVEVRYKGYRHGFSDNPRHLPIAPGMAVIVGVDSGCDLGRVGLAGSCVPVSPEDLQEGMEIHPILRIATEADLKIERGNAARERKALRTCNDLVARHRLPMKLMGAEYRHDRGRLTFYFTADHRVDFRALVRDLAQRFRTRIELRQIGVRDAAKFLGGVGSCGRTLCCSTFLNQFSPVNLRMAKQQMMVVAPEKLSGVCGRLKCCLRYEHSVYLRESECFPKPGTLVRFGEERGRVLAIDILGRTVVVRGPDRTITRVPLTALLPEEKISARRRDPTEDADPETRRRGRDVGTGRETGRDPS